MVEERKLFKVLCKKEIMNNEESVPLEVNVTCAVSYSRL